MQESEKVFTYFFEAWPARPVPTNLSSLFFSSVAPLGVMGEQRCYPCQNRSIPVGRGGFVAGSVDPAVLTAFTAALAVDRVERVVDGTVVFDVVFPLVPFLLAMVVDREERTSVCYRPSCFYVLPSLLAPNHYFS